MINFLGVETFWVVRDILFVIIPNLGKALTVDK
jgi:hypothetical protein